MKIKILTIDSELESAKNIGYDTTTYAGDFADKYDNTIMIRWGNSRPAFSSSGSRDLEFKHVINKHESIRLNCSKPSASKLLSQVVNTPTIWEKKVPAGVLAVVRPNEHSAGFGFSVQEGPFNVPFGHYATRYLDVTKVGAEYRVWFCGNKTMCARRYKMMCNEEQKYPCRSNWGYNYINGISKDLHNQTMLAAKKIGLEFGAADILYYKNKWYFLELNSAPSIDHRIVREFFQDALKVLINKKFPEKKEILVPVMEIKPGTEVKKKEESPVIPISVSERVAPTTTG